VSAAATPTVDEQLAWEARQRPRAAAAAVAAGVLTLAGGIGSALVYKDFPRVLLVDALRAALNGASRVGLKAPEVLFYDDHAASLLVSALVLGLGGLLIAPALVYLYRATRFRREQTPSAAYVLAIAGPIALAISQLVQQVAVMIDARNFASSSDHSREAVKAVLESGPVVAAAIIRQAAVLILGFALVMIVLNAMRAGLLTRFMGVLGIIVGVLFVIPIGSPLPIVQAFWLVALGVLIAGRWPSGVPSAWASGEAKPWPTQQELREARAQAPGRDEPASSGGVVQDDDSDEADDELAADAATGRPHPSSKKRKRKRRV